MLQEHQDKCHLHREHREDTESGLVDNRFWNFVSSLVPLTHKSHPDMALQAMINS
jgi:hypothetical protein